MEGVMARQRQGQAPETRLLGREATAVYLGMTLRSVDRLVNKGVLCPVQIPGVHRTLFDRKDLERLIDAAKAEGQDRGERSARPGA
jgi:hypothetical protein